MQLSEDASALALFVLACVCAFALLLVPRALVPVEGPSLSLDASAVRKALEADARAAAAADEKPSEHAKQLRALMHTQGKAELHDVELSTVRRARMRRLHDTFEALLHEQGKDAALAERALAVERFEAALELRLPKAEHDGVLGIFPNALEAHAATHDGLVLAPHFVLRTLYKARWNKFADRAPDWGLSDIELRAFHGFLALHAENVATPTRLQSLRRYETIAGKPLPEALGALQFREGDFGHAARSFEQAYRQTGLLRTRNYQRGAEVAAATTRGGGQDLP